MTIKIKKSAVINDTLANGGAMSSTDVQNNAVENLFPNVTEAERTAGIDRYRKFWAKKETGTFNTGRIFIRALTTAGDYVLLKAGTDSDTQAQADDYTDWAGAGEIDVALDTSSGATNPFTADYAVTAVGVYDTSLIAVMDLDADTVEYLTVTGAPAWTGTNAELDTTGNCKAAHAVKTQGTVSGTGAENFDLDGLTLIISINGGADQTITFAADGRTAAQTAVLINADLTGGTAAANGTKVDIVTDDYYLANSIQVKTESTAKTELGLDTTIHYGTDGTVIATVIELGNIASSHTAPVATTAGDGSFDDSGAPITDDDIGCVTDDFTFTFTSATEFGCVGTLSGDLGTGATTANFSPANEGSYYFVVDKDAWTGTWASGDTLTFSTVHSAKPVWAREIVPALTAAYSDNQFELELRGQS